MSALETVILKNLISNETYLRQVIPFLEPEYFASTRHQTAFRLISSVFAKYNKPPTKEVLLIELDRTNADEHTYEETSEFLKKEIDTVEALDQKWLIDTTEKFCKDRALFLALERSVILAEDKKSKQEPAAIIDILTKAIGVSFDSKVGHDHFDDAGERYDLYTQKVNKVPFDLDILNTITDGGAEEKTLNLVLGGTNTGKTAVLCHLAAGYLKAGRDVLYITCEMADKKISQRIDANLFDLPLKQMKNLSKEDYLKRLDIIKKKGAGRLQVKEYPTATANANHFRTLLNELKTKKSFVPKVIIVDYLGICTSSRIREGNSYTIFKSVAEELRGLFVEHEVVGWSAAQTNRNGVKNNDPDLGEVSESYGLSSTADFMLVLITDEELEANGQIIGKQLKNRYNDKASNRRFLLGFDRQRMKLFDVEHAATPTQNKNSPISSAAPSPKPEKFSGFNFDESEEDS